MPDPLIAALTRLVEREGGYDAVANAAGHNSQALYQIVAGITLPSGKPRGVGRLLRERLDRAFPDWLEGNRTGLPLSGRLSTSTVAQDVSHPQIQTALATAFKVPVIGTLSAGADSMMQLKATADGIPIGHVLAPGASPGSYALQVFGDELHPAVRHGAVLVIEPGAPCVEGELVLVEMRDGYHLVCELVALRDDAVITMPANGGPRRSWARSKVAEVLPVATMLPSWKLQPR